MTFLIGLAALIAAACSDNTGTAATSGGSPTVSATPAIAAPTAAPTTEAIPNAALSTAASPASAGAVTQPDADVVNVLEHVEVLASAIGVRAAGTEGEDQAAAYIASVLEAAGYETTIEPFPISTRIDGSRITVADSSVTIRPLMMNGSATGEETGLLIYGGLGARADLAGLDIDGRILLLDRGIISFGEKVRNAELAGAVAVVIANNEAGPYGGNLGERPASIPAVAVTRAAGAELRLLAEAGGIATVTAAIESIEAESQNVVGRSGDVCRFVIGGHYDSVPEGPGANDNASGTALMLELARSQQTDGLCVVAFGAEEIGLFGSQAFVATTDLKATVFMLNFDMAGRLEGPTIIGDVALTNLLLAAVEGLPIRAGSFPPFASSDHATFLSAGIPSVTITSGGDPAIHTAGDDVDNVAEDSLRTMLEVGDRVLEAALVASG